MNSLVANDELPVLQESETCCPSFLTSTVSDEEARSTARIFRALADPARVQLLSMIANAGEPGACVCELVTPLDLSQPTISHHLKILSEAGLVSRERRASWVYYQVRRDTLAAVAVVLGAAGK
jgi:ArsR family transcriptional regulator